MSDETTDYNATQFYHPTKGTRVVRSAEEEAALGPGWHDSPKKGAPKPAAPAATPAAGPAPTSTAAAARRKAKE